MPTRKLAARSKLRATTVRPDRSLALAVPGAIQVVLGNIIEPKLLGDSLGLHPVAMMLTLIFWGTLWGIPGMLLAAPISSVGCILLERSELTRPLAELLAGRLPGSAVAPPAADTESDSDA